jgi:iron complex outermembrane receptor protein
VQYEFTPTIMGYATYSTGYKGPALGYNPTDGFEATPAPVKPETSQDYEVGFKSQLFDRRLTLDIDAFYARYTNFQAQAYFYDAANPAASTFILTNAGALETKGVEGEADVRVTPDLTLSANAAYIPTRYVKFNIPCVAEPAGAGPLVNPSTPGGTANCFAGPGGGLLFNAAGYPLPDAPKFAYTLSGDYRHEILSGYVLTAHVNWSYRSSTYTVVADPNTIQAGYGLLGLDIGAGPADGSWKLSVFARNLLDQQFVDGIFAAFFDNGAGTGNPHPVQGYSNIFSNEAARTVGLKLSVKVR